MDYSNNTTPIFWSDTDIKLFFPFKQHSTYNLAESHFSILKCLKVWQSFGYYVNIAAHVHIIEMHQILWLIIIATMRLLTLGHSFHLPKQEVKCKLVLSILLMKREIQELSKVVSSLMKIIRELLLDLAAILECFLQKKLLIESTTCK